MRYEDWAIPFADLERWKERHPRMSSGAGAHFFVDFLEGGSKKIATSRGCGIYSWTACRDLVGQRDQWKCRICGEAGDEVHHILPRKDGGSDHPENLITLCRKHHLQTFKRKYKGLPGIPDKGQSILEIFREQTDTETKLAGSEAK